MSSEYIRCGSSGVPALFTHFMASSVSHSAATPLFLPALTVFLSCGTFIGFFRHVWYLVLCFWGVCAACADGSCAGCYCYLAQGCRGGIFFPNSVVFALVLGLSVLFQEFFALGLVFLGCTCVVAFSLRMPLLRLGHRLR